MTLAVNIAQIGSNNTTFRNRIINGAMVIDQRNAGASVTVTAAGGAYPLDRFYGQAAVTSKFTVQQSSDVPTGQGFIKSLVATSSSAYTVGAAEYFIIRQAVEGLNCYDFMFGSANAKTVTLSFWAKSSLTGTFGGHLTNSGSSRWYPFTYSIPTANTWTQISVTIAGDTSGTWLTTSGVGVYVGWSMGVGSSLETTGNVWTASTGISATGTVDVVATNGATFYITGVQLEVGSTASPFEYRLYGTEFALCQRYFQTASAGSFVCNAGAFASFQFAVRLRDTPSVLTVTPNSGTWGTSGSNGTGFYGTNSTLSAIAFSATAEL